MIHRIRVALDASQADRRQVTAVVNTESKGRDDLVLVTAGIDLTHYRRNPVVLWMHNPDWPIAKAASITVQGDKLVMVAQFPPEGASERADETLALIRAGVINAVSAGFDPKASEPLDPANLGAGRKITRCELQEVSFVSIPALPDALVSERANGNPNEGWKCGAAGDLPINETATWDADAARARIFRWAGYDGEHPDPVKARRAFLAYNASKPALRESYKLPFADVIDGRLTAVRRGLDAAAAMLERTDIPEREKERAHAVIKVYEATEPEGPGRHHSLAWHRARAERIRLGLPASAPRTHHSLAWHRLKAERVKRDLLLGK